ncbi:MAG: glycosyltransferase family 9 protein [Verrucomicrobia bacterium]|nr:MAG: glycosyltransferase family 9 protein [Verrucomicrobiota bacterium]
MSGGAVLRACWRQGVQALASPGFVGPVARVALRLRGLGGSGTWEGFGAIERLAVIRHDGLGDLVVTTGFLRELRRAAPRAHITLVTRPEWVEAMAACPHVDGVVGFPVVFSSRWMLHRNIWAAWRFARRELWPRRFQAVLVPQAAFSLFEARFLALFSGAPVRVGRRDAASDPAGAGWGLLTRVEETPVGEHEAESCARFLRALGAGAADPRLELHWSATADREASTMVPATFGNGGWVALGVGASQREKLWPLERFVEIARRMRARGWSLVLVGGGDLSDPAGRLAREIGEGVLDLTGRLSLPATASLLSRCRLYVGNDTGPMHVAAAVGVPVVEIVGWPADVSPAVGGTPMRIGPFCAHRRIVQPAEPGLPPMVQIGRVTVDDVWHAVESLHAETSRFVPGGKHG